MICGGFFLAKTLRRKEGGRTGSTLLYLAGVVILMAACNKEVLKPDLRSLNASDCKDFTLKSADSISKTQDCLTYAWNDNVLTISRINAAFNCCPEKISADLKVAGDTLIIIEREKSSLCDCNCLYDLDYSITGVRKDKWIIQVVEPYVQSPDQELIVFEADFAKVKEGRVCVERTGYPWR